MGTKAIKPEKVWNKVRNITLKVRNKECHTGFEQHGMEKKEM